MLVVSPFSVAHHYESHPNVAFKWYSMYKESEEAKESRPSISFLGWSQHYHPVGRAYYYMGFCYANGFNTVRVDGYTATLYLIVASYLNVGPAMSLLAQDNNMPIYLSDGLYKQAPLHADIYYPFCETVLTDLADNHGDLRAMMVLYPRLAHVYDDLYMHRLCRAGSAVHQVARASRLWVQTNDDERKNQEAMAEAMAWAVKSANQGYMPALHLIASFRWNSEERILMHKKATEKEKANVAAIKELYNHPLQEIFETEGLVHLWKEAMFVASDRMRRQLDNEQCHADKYHAAAAAVATDADATAAAVDD